MTKSTLAPLTRCTQAVLRAFDIEGYPEYASGTLAYIKAQGYKLTKVEYPGRSLRDFYTSGQHDMQRDYIIFTIGHVLCIRQGIITDTAGCGQHTRVESVWGVTKA